jgi:hypothetical protein
MKNIIIVKYISFESEYTILQAFCEIMVKNGYIVRRDDELFGCKKCNKVLLSKNMWNALKEKGFKSIPEKWSEYCKEC